MILVPVTALAENSDISEARLYCECKQLNGGSRSNSSGLNRYFVAQVRESGFRSEISPKL